MKKLSSLLLALAVCCAGALLGGCSLYEDIDTEINRRPETESGVQPGEWEAPEEGGEAVGH